MLMVKEVIIYSSMALALFFLIQLFNGRIGKYELNPLAECRSDQFCGGYEPPIPPHDATATFPNDAHYGDK